MTCQVHMYNIGTYMHVRTYMYVCAHYESMMHIIIVIYQEDQRLLQAIYLILPAAGAAALGVYIRQVTSAHGIANYVLHNYSNICIPYIS